MGHARHGLQGAAPPLGDSVCEREERQEGLQGAAAPLGSDLDMLNRRELLTCFLRPHITQVRTQPPHAPALRL